MSSRIRLSAPPTLPPSPRPSAQVTDAEPDVTWGKGGIDDWGWHRPQPEQGQASRDES
jgi:hypothetical protein